MAAQKMMINLRGPVTVGKTVYAPAGNPHDFSFDPALAQAIVAGGRGDPVNTAATGPAARVTRDTVTGGTTK